MALNESALNELALNEGVETIELVGTLSVVGAAARVDDPVGKLSLVGSVHQQDLFGKISLTGFAHQVSHEGKLAITGFAHQVSHEGQLCLVGVVRDLDVPIGAQGIGSSTPTGVLPQTGSAIFTKWERVSAKEMLVHRHYDFHESGRARFNDTRRAWRLEMEVGPTKHNEVAAFFASHVWAGKAFYFYDLQANGYQYDATGVLTTGRYKVRFVEEDFPRVYSVGTRFRIPFSVIECE